MQTVWRQHWDCQLYKALEVQYLQGLECLSQSLPDVEVKVVFKQQKLQYEPPLEELRARHYRCLMGCPQRHWKASSQITAESTTSLRSDALFAHLLCREFINTFLSLPLKMKGVSDLSERAGFFRPIANSAAAAAARVYEGAETLFTRLGEELKKYQVGN